MKGYMDESGTFKIYNLAVDVYEGHRLEKSSHPRKRA